MKKIQRAWITFDNRVFLWKYDDDKDFNVWDGLDQIVVSVGLVRPKGTSLCMCCACVLTSCSTCSASCIVRVHVRAWA